MHQLKNPYSFLLSHGLYLNSHDLYLNLMIPCPLNPKRIEYQEMALSIWISCTPKPMGPV